jgi:hypothetical protein
MSDPYKFIKLEDEIMLRRSVKAAFAHEGWPGLYMIMGELSRSLEIVGEVAIELLEEENKKNLEGDQDGL